MSNIGGSSSSADINNNWLVDDDANYADPPAEVTERTLQVHRFDINLVDAYDPRLVPSMEGSQLNDKSGKNAPEEGLARRSGDFFLEASFDGQESVAEVLDQNDGKTIETDHDDLGMGSETDRHRPRGSTRKKHLHSVGVQGRKLSSHADDEKVSPYACKIIEIPPKKKVNAQKVVVCDRDHRRLDEQFKNQHPTSHREEHDALTKLLASSDNETTVDGVTQFVAGPMPLLSWPIFGSPGPETVGAETQTIKSISSSVHFKPDESQTDSKTEWPTKPEETTDMSQTEVDAARMLYLESLASKLEQGLFSASEAASVILQTIFRDTLRNPNAIEGVLESHEFQAFLHAPNEAQALRELSNLFSSASQSITQYLQSLEEVGITFIPNTGFASRSSQALLKSDNSKGFQSVLKAKANLTSHLWNHSKPLDNFQLNLFRNPDTGDIIQMITCQNSVYRARYSTSPVQTDRIRSIISATTENFGLPEVAEPARLFDTFVRCSSFASTKLVTAKEAITKLARVIYNFYMKSTAAKYQVDSPKSIRDVNRLNTRLREINIFAGIVYQTTEELTQAFERIQVGIRKSMEVQKKLQIVRVPGYPNPHLNKSGQLPSGCGVDVPIHSAMIEVSEGIRGISHALRMGQFCLETERCGEVHLKKDHRKFIKDYLEGVKYLGSSKEIDFGSLVMSLMCSAELIIHFDEAVCSTVDGVNRSAISSHLGKINWAMVEITSALRRMKNDAYLLTLQSTKRLRALKVLQMNNIGKKRIFDTA